MASYSIKGRDGNYYDLNSIFGTSSSVYNIDQLNYIQKNGSKYIKGLGNTSSLIYKTTGNGYSYIFGYNSNYSIDACTSTDYYKSVQDKYNQNNKVNAMNFLCSYYEDYENTTLYKKIHPWCDYLIAVVVGAGGGGASCGHDDDSYMIGGSGGGGGLVVAKIKFDFTTYTDLRFNIIIGTQGVSSGSPNTYDGGATKGGDSVVSVYDHTTTDELLRMTSYGGEKGVNIRDVSYSGGVGGGYFISQDSVFGQTKIYEEIYSVNGQNGTTEQRGDDGVGSSWGSRSGQPGATSVADVFHPDSVLNTYDGTLTGTNGARQYGRGGISSGLGDDNDDGASVNPNGTSGGKGWARVYFMRD